MRVYYLNKQYKKAESVDSAKSFNYIKYNILLLARQQNITTATLLYA